MLYRVFLTCVYAYLLIYKNVIKIFYLIIKCTITKIVFCVFIFKIFNSCLTR